MNFKKRDDGGLEVEVLHESSGKITKLFIFSISKDNIDVLKEVIVGSKDVGDEEKETRQKIDSWYLQNVTPTNSNLHLREYIAKRLGSKKLDTKNQQPKDFSEDLGALVDKMEQSTLMEYKGPPSIQERLGVFKKQVEEREPNWASFIAGEGTIKDPVVRKECLHPSAARIHGTDPSYPVLWCEDCGAIRYMFASDNSWKLPENSKEK